jgi:hypothetical protein
MVAPDPGQADCGKAGKIEPLVGTFQNEVYVLPLEKAFMVNVTN